ncbi:MAG: hypothetical protein JO072_16210 [Parafilimonas sp.]|nr:hypothetical protein [Parafilimonas sp.]
MHSTNVELSKNELELVISSEFILTKNRVIEKVYNLFGALSENYKEILNEHTAVLPAGVFTSSPKIYKGENYLQLPYVMMDYPRIFSKDDVFAVRSFFWWGNYFSITLHLSGKYLQQFRNAILFNLNNADEYFVCINEEQWQHHFEISNYQPLKTIHSIETILNKSFFKLAKKIELAEWKNAGEFYTETYNNLLTIITNDKLVS